MPYKDKEARLKVSRESMRKKRVDGLTLGVNKEGVNIEGSQDWETLPLGEIKSALPQDIIDYIKNVASKYGRREERLRRAYKYKVWHDANFINGIHRDLLEVTK